MKQIILCTIFLLMSFFVFSQNESNVSPNWNKPLIGEKQNEHELKIYPNPCKTDKITIDFGSHLIAEILVTNITGKQVLNKKLDFHESKKVLRLENIQNGMYLIKVKSTDNKVVVKKFVVS